MPVEDPANCRQPETLPPIDAIRELRTIEKAVQKGQYRDLAGVEGVLDVRVGELAGS